jgi:DNA-binding NarL/FixJ family response regulator
MSQGTANKKLDKLIRRLDILIVVQLVNSGLTLKEIAKTLDISEDTIERMIPFRKLKPKRHKE